MPLDSIETSLAERIQKRQKEIIALEDSVLKGTADDPLAAVAAVERAELELKGLLKMEQNAARRARPIDGNDRVGRAGGGGDDDKITPDLLVRSCVVALEAHISQRRAADVLAERYGQDQQLAHVVRLTNPIRKAAQNPATTFQAGYASELVRQTYGAWIDLLKEAGAVSQVPWLMADFSEGSPVVFPMRQIPSAPFPANFEAAFRKEGDPVRVGRLSLISAELKPFSAGVIGHFTKELLKASTPSIETCIRDAIVADTVEMLDRVVFDDSAATDLRPAGLLNGIAAPNTRAATGVTLAATEADLNSMIAQLFRNRVGGGRPTWVMNKLAVLRLDSLMTDLGVFPYRADIRAGRLKGFPIAQSTFLPEDELLLLDAAHIGFAGSAPTWEVSDQATIHEETQTPLPISTPGAPATVAAPTRSLFQTNSAAVKAVYELSWLPLRPGVVQQLTNFATTP